MQTPFHMLSMGLMLATAMAGSSSPYQDMMVTDAAPKMVAASASVSIPAPSAAAVIKRNRHGQYHVDAIVNGTSVRFLVDTGATAVALSAKDARRIGLDMDPRRFKVIGTGASGPVRGRLVTLDEVRLGHKSVPKVHGAVLEGANVSLLGTSFLAQMDRIEISGDTMIIH